MILFQNYFPFVFKYITLNFNVMTNSNYNESKLRGEIRIYFDDLWKISWAPPTALIADVVKHGTGPHMGQGWYSKYRYFKTHFFFQIMFSWIALSSTYPTLRKSQKRGGNYEFYFWLLICLFIIFVSGLFELLISSQAYPNLSNMPPQFVFSFPILSGGREAFT